MLPEDERWFLGSGAMIKASERIAEVQIEDATMILFHGGRELARTSDVMNTGQIVRWARGRLPMVTS